MDKMIIADCAFLPYGKSMAYGQDNKDCLPDHFEWELCDPLSARFVTDGFIPLSKGDGQIAWLLEPFLLHPSYYFATRERNFDYVLTSNKYLARNYGWLWYPYGGSFIAPELWQVYKKSKDISMISTRKRMVPGHTLRLEIIERHKEKLDIFGMDSLTRKFDCLQPYRYSIVVEGERCSSYFTEKLIDCFSVGTMPIYWGCPDIGLYFNTGGIIEVESIEQLGAILEVATPSFYKSCLPAIKENMKIAKQYRTPENWVFEKYPFLFGR